MADSTRGILRRYRVAILCIVFALGLVSYVGAYLVCVRPVPSYAAVMGQTTSTYIGHAGRYHGIGAEGQQVYVELAFWPVHSLDRWLRPGYWYRDDDRR